MRIESRVGKVQHAPEKVYKFIADFRNFDQIIPRDKVSEWSSSEDTCEFSLDMLGKTKLNIIEREPSKLVKIKSDDGISQYNFTLWVQIKNNQDALSYVKITIEPHLNQVLLSMVKKPLKEFVDSMVSEIETRQF